MKTVKNRPDSFNSGKESAVSRMKGAVAGLWQDIKDKVYDLKVKIHQKTSGGKKKKERTLNAKKYGDLIFYCLMAALPLLQFCIFYVGVNINSILLAFKDYEYGTGVYQWVGFQHLGKVFKDFVTDGVLIKSITNSLLVYVFNFIFGVGLALLFSFYIYKRYLCHNLFKVLLFMPSILSAIVMVVLFSYFVERAIPEVWYKLFGKEIEGLLGNGKLTMGTIIFYNIWVGFGTSILMYVGAMNGISESIVESATLEGVSPLQEFYHITLPLIYPSITTFVVVGVATIFTNQLNLFAFYGQDAEFRLYTLGYYLFMNTQKASIAEYPYLSAMGIALTLVALPLTLLVKYLMEKFGPKVI